MDGKQLFRYASACPRDQAFWAGVGPEEISCLKTEVTRRGQQAATRSRIAEALVAGTLFALMMAGLKEQNASLQLAEALVFLTAAAVLLLGGWSRLWLFSPCFAAALATMRFWLPGAQALSVNAGFYLAASLVGSLAAGHFLGRAIVRFLNRRAELVGDALMPLLDISGAGDLVDKLRGSEAVRQYHDRVCASGRELLEVDRELMEQLAGHDAWCDKCTMSSCMRPAR